jgi:small subunit ribosomal protein S3Ae
MADEKPEQKPAPAKAAPSSSAKSATVGLKKRRKRWYPIVAPKLFDNMPLGETLLDESAQLQGKFLTMSMMNISGDPKKQNVNIKFEVTKVVEGKGLSEIRGYELQQNSLRRLMRRGRKKVEDSFVIKTVDDKYVICKPLIITSGNASGSKLTDIKKHARQLLKEIIHQNTFETVITDLLDYKPQNYLRDLLSKIYPVRSVEVRVFTMTDETHETVNDILTKMVVRKVEEEEPEEPENADAPSEESSAAPIDQMQEIEEEKKARRSHKSESKETSEENPISEGV